MGINSKITRVCLIVPIFLVSIILEILPSATILCLDIRTTENVLQGTLKMYSDVAILDSFLTVSNSDSESCIYFKNIDLKYNLRICKHVH
jgi:hypothetical protein